MSVQNYYHFSKDGKECIIKRHDTPVPWLNLLSNDRFVAWVSHEGNIVESCVINNRKNRLTNPNSGYIYIRDTDTSEYFMLNKPKKGASWRSIQGMGYTSITSSYLDLTATATYFVPRDEDILVWMVTIHNDSSINRNVDLFSAVEWCLGDPRYFTVLPGGDFYGIGNNLKRVYFENDVLYANNYSWLPVVPAPFMGQKVWPFTGFFTTSLPVKSFACDKTLFFGRSGSIEKPVAVEKGICSSKSAFGFTDFPLGVLHNSIKLAPNEGRKIVIMMGMVRDKTDVQKIREKYMDPATTEKLLMDVKSFWKNYIERSVNVKTPEKEIDRLVNIWIKYQHRTSMLQNLNNGLRGFGIWCPAYPYGEARPSDLRETGNVPCDLKLIEEDIVDFLQGTHTSLMLKSDMKLKWEPEAVPKPSPPYPHDGRALWPCSVCWYIKERGDLSFLDRKVSCKDHPWSPKSGEGTIFECMKRAIDYFLSGLSERGLPRLNPGLGDWNDALNLISREGKGESVLTAVELCRMLRECAEVARAYGKMKEAEAWMEQYDRIKSAVNKYAWDGEWYIRAFTDEGTPVGSSKNEEGRIYLSVQALAVLSGVADEERAQRCLQSVDELLMTKYGPRLCAPPYTKLDYHIGVATNFAPGWRENGGIWNRTTGWAVMANCLANRANQAFDMYKKASLTNVCKDVDRFRLPPYAYAEYYVGAGPDFGRGQFQWCMGKAGTMWRAYVYYILGVRPVLDGLLIDPKIPNLWEGFKLVRPFRGAIYEINVSNPNKVSMGVKLMRVDGKIVKGNVLPSLADGKTHTVKVVLEG